MPRLQHLSRRVAHASLAVGLILSTVHSAVAQIDTPVAAEARQALREVRRRYEPQADWNAWSAKFNLRDVQYELHAGERGQPDVLRAAAGTIKAAGVYPFTSSPFVRLAGALDSRAAELTPLPPDEWPDSCKLAAEAYEPVSIENLEAARRSWQRRLDEFEPVLLSSRVSRSHWTSFLFWAESRELASAMSDPAPSDALLDRLETRWASAPTVWDDERLFEASLAGRRYLRKLRGHLAQETRQQHAASWAELGESIAAWNADPSDTSALARAVLNRERLGEASRLTSSIRNTLSRPNLIVQVDRGWIESRFNQNVSDSYRVNDVFAGTRSIGNGQMVGTMRAEILPSSAVGRCRLRFNGTSTARTTGRQNDVRVVSRATTRVTATKPFHLDVRGLTTEPARAGADTKIVYENIDAPGLRRRRREAVNVTYARRPQAERESEAYARRSILEQINNRANGLVKDFNSVYRTDLRDPRITALRPAPEVRVRTAAEDVSWECLLEGRETFAAPSAPPEFASEAKIVFHVAASAIKELAAIELAGQEFNARQLAERMGRTAEEIKSADSEEFRVTFSDDPCDVSYANNGVRVQLFLTKFDSADVAYPAMTVNVTYEPQARDGRLVLVRVGRLRVTPGTPQDGETPKVSGRQQTLRLAVERKLARSLPTELERSDFKLPIASNGAAALQVNDVRIEGPWLQLAFAPMYTSGTRR